MFAGIWGSAFTVLLQRVLRERKLPSDIADEMSNMGDLRDELSTSFRAFSILPKLPVISVGSQMEKSDRTGRTKICRFIILTNWFASQFSSVDFTYMGDWLTWLDRKISVHFLSQNSMYDLMKRPENL